MRAFGKFAVVFFSMAGLLGCKSLHTRHSSKAGPALGHASNQPESAQDSTIRQAGYEEAAPSSRGAATKPGSRMANGSSIASRTSSTNSGC